MWISTEAMTQGQAAAAGRPVNGNIARPTNAAPTDIRTVVTRGSRPRLTAAFQPAWQSAANKTAAKTKRSSKINPYRCYSAFQSRYEFE